MHEIRYLTFGARMTPTGVQRECDKVAKRDGEYHCGLYRPVRFPNVICKNEDEAMKYIEEHDDGDYDCLAIKYKEHRKTRWLAKIEYHV